MVSSSTVIQVQKETTEVVGNGVEGVIARFGALLTIRISKKIKLFL